MSKTPAHNIRVALADAGMTQEALARELGITLRAVQKWVAGDSEPKSRQLVDMARVLDRDAAWFFEDPDTERAAA